MLLVAVAERLARPVLRSERGRAQLRVLRLARHDCGSGDVGGDRRDRRRECAGDKEQEDCAPHLAVIDRASQHDRHSRE